jgi:RimJ/RimL family protein N-acetyltransferase
MDVVNTGTLCERSKSILKTIETYFEKGMVKLSINLIQAKESDLAVLAEMNKGLINDECSPNPMSIQELEERMKGWLFSDRNIDLIYMRSEIVGYALYQFRKNQYFPNEREVYLRQYYIKPAYRMKGLGQEGIKLLKEIRFKDIQTVNIDVLINNQVGMNFWQKVGFIPYSMTMNMNMKNK